MIFSRLFKHSFFRHILTTHSVAYLATSILPRAIGLLIVPFFTLVISPAEYGIAGVYLSAVTTIVSCLEYGLLVKRTYVSDGISTALSEVFCACVVLYFVAAIAVMSGVFFIWEYLRIWVQLPRDWLLLALITGFFQATLSMCFGIWQISKSVRIYCTYRIVFTLIHAAFSLIALFCLSLGWKALALAPLAASLPVLFIILHYLVRDYGLTWQLHAQSLTKYARAIITLFPDRLSVTLFTCSGPVLVAYYAGLIQSGLYVFGIQFGLMVVIAYESIITAFIPHLVSRDSVPTELTHSTKGKLMAAYIAMVCGISLCLMIIAPPLIHLIFPPTYAGAIPFIFWIALARCFQGITRMVMELSYFYVPNFRRISFLSLACAFIYIACTILLLKELGGIGGAMGLALGQCIWMLAMIINGTLLKTASAK